MAKTVCVIGAGPSGLVAAKTLAHDYPKDTFQVTVFESSHRIGGLWPISKVDDGLVNPSMCTNQSRHTVSFSDLAWPESTPQFPAAWQVGDYLQRYVQEYPGYEIKLETRVIETKLEDDKWKVQVESRKSEPAAQETLEFDHLIVATGFFGKARTPNILDGLAAPVQHSSKIRNVKDLLTDDGKSGFVKGRKIVVVGGQMSGVEIAAFIANQLSSASHSLDDLGIPNTSEYQITHVVQRPFWVMPYFFPRNPQVEDSAGEKVTNSSPSFLPLDLVSYNLAVRPPGPVSNTSGHITPEGAARTHDFMRDIIGGDQSEFGTPELAVTGSALSEPPYLAVSDQYNEYVRSGLIKMVRGKVAKLSSQALDAITVVDDGSERTIDDVAAVVFASGFDSTASISFLPKDVLQALDFDPSNEKFPLQLNVHASTSNKFPTLGFVGFYRSQYWGVMEKQAQYLGRLWMGDAKASTALLEDQTCAAMLKLRNNPRAAQFPMGDYAYLMESFRSILGIARHEPEPTGDGSTRTGIVLPARYLDTARASEQQKAHSAASIVELAKTLAESADAARFVQRAIFRAMQGVWKLDRVIDSRRSDYPSGTLLGTAHFHPRHPTDGKYDLEYLYNESGEFVSPQGFRFTATRSYAYRYQESTDTLSAWFVKPKDNKTVDYLFHEFEVVIPNADVAANRDGSQPWRAKSAHLCIEDMYNVRYEFRFRGAGIESWTQEYTVNGPAKDYTIRNVYRRPVGRGGV